jgi:hypothetical protein
MTAPHRQDMRAAIAAEGAGHAALLAGDRDAAAPHLRTAAALYRTSWEEAPPRSYGRLIGMLKAAVLAGDGRFEAAYARGQLGPDAESPPAQYARALAALIDGDDAAAGAAAAAMGAGSPAFARTADAISALADRDAAAYAEALGAIVADFAGRDAHLTGVPIADTAAMLEVFAEARGMAARPASPLLPPQHRAHG